MFSVFKKEYLHDHVVKLEIQIKFFVVKKFTLWCNIRSLFFQSLQKIFDEVRPNKWMLINHKLINDLLMAGKYNNGIKILVNKWFYVNYVH